MTPAKDDNAMSGTHPFARFAAIAGRGKAQSPWRDRDWGRFPVVA
ncbi:hypothetical protein BMS3Bbin10_00057 [bacterium BMS3Bbin10]|nr:hypothetical protein BMS3Bbin10_00057 [bacterium BMS3Bbin10]